MEWVAIGRLRICRDTYRGPEIRGIRQDIGAAAWGGCMDWAGPCFLPLLFAYRPLARSWALVVKRARHLYPLRLAHVRWSHRHAHGPPPLSPPHEARPLPSLGSCRNPCRKLTLAGDLALGPAGHQMLLRILNACLVAGLHLPCMSVPLCLPSLSLPSTVSFASFSSILVIRTSRPHCVAELISQPGGRAHNRALVLEMMISNATSAKVRVAGGAQRRMATTTTCRASAVPEASRRAIMLSGMIPVVMGFALPAFALIPVSPYHERPTTSDGPSVECSSSYH